MQNLLRDSCLLMMSLWCASISLAQPYVRQVDAIPVTENGSVIAQPFAGGVNAPKHEFVDIDGDGDLDLFVFDNDNVLDFYRNVGTVQTPEFRLCRGCVAMPHFLFWLLFVDLNGDGKTDLCTDDSSSGVRYYRNEGTPLTPDFVLQASTMLDSAGNPMNAGFSSVPAFVDIDGDSVIDFLSSNSLDGSVNFYRNIGTKFLPKFKFVTGSFQGITVLGDSCYMTSLRKEDHHGAGVLTYVDIDSNGTKDMFYGDLYSHGIFLMQNAGTATEPRLICATNRYPDPSLLTLGFNQPNFVDIDGDGDLDLFVGVLNNLERHGFWFYRNAGTPSAPTFEFVTKDVLSMVDVGANANPALIDIDGNGTLDLFVGSLDGGLWYYQNTGSVLSPSFGLVDTMFAGISGNYIYAPAFGDIDADGDKDLFIGRFDGTIKFYRNIGSVIAPQFVADTSPADTINVLQNASPFLVDFDGDGDLDLFVGRGNGQINYYQNNGDSATFAPELQSTKFAGIDVGEDARVCVRDIDGDDDNDLVVGNAEGTLLAFLNIDGTNWTVDGNTFSEIEPMRESSPAFGDIDGDGDQDLFVGTSKGGMQFYRNQMVVDVREPSPLPSGVELSQNYPNPFNPLTVIRYSIPARSWVTLKVYDMLGREIATLVDEMEEAGARSVFFPAKHGTRDHRQSFHLSSGIYFYRLTVGGRSMERKMLFIQ